MSSRGKRDSVGLLRLAKDIFQDASDGIGLNDNDLETLLRQIRSTKDKKWLRDCVDKATAQYGNKVSQKHETAPLVWLRLSCFYAAQVDFDRFTQMLCCPPWRELLPRIMWGEFAKTVNNNNGCPPT